MVDKPESMFMSKELLTAAVDGFKGSFELLARLVRAIVDTATAFVNHEESHVVATLITDDYTKPIDLGIAKKLRNDRDYRKAFFRTETADSIALQIRDLRKDRNDLTQKELAERADMKQSAISRIEKAEYASWSFNTLSRVAEALDAHLVVTFERDEDAIRKYEKGDVAHADAKAYELRRAWIQRGAPWFSDAHKAATGMASDPATAKGVLAERNPRYIDLAVMCLFIACLFMVVDYMAGL